MPLISRQEFNVGSCRPFAFVRLFPFGNDFEISYKFKVPLKTKFGHLGSTAVELHDMRVRRGFKFWQLLGSGPSRRYISNKGFEQLS